MGLLLSKPTASKKSTKSLKEPNQLQLQQQHQHQQQQPTINFESLLAIQKDEDEEEAASSTSEVRQIIIKIQLAKMENGNDSSVVHQVLEEQPGVAAIMSADTLNANEQVVNVTLAEASNRTAGSSTEAPKTERQHMNNNHLAGSNSTGAASAISTLQLNDEHEEPDDDVDDDDDDDESLLRRRDAAAEAVDYCEVLETTLPVSEMLSTEAQQSKQANGNSCCRSRSNKSLSMGATVSSTSATSKRRCCKCKCRDAIRGLRGMLESSSSNTDKKEPTTRKPRPADRRSTPPTLSHSTAAGTTSASIARQRKRNSVAVPEPSQLAIWTAPTNGDVIIRISSPQFVVESPNARVTVGPNIRVISDTAKMEVVPIPIQAASSQPPAQHNQQRVHSQIDLMHCLVPDLEKIINSSFYWGKMDRYEAERLLEGKPEGTFLLRDSAQEEFLFSVTFRKYGRSLHARIEQSGHKFSFDCHDPCVFTAPNVTGLLEHYKDPSCVMFFEPCLTMPLHRRQTFSLQQLARATIVSNTNYDGINQLELPGRLKSYLKEYHYKQKLRVKPCDANTPAPFYGNV